jgi:hypothetical protein
VLERDREVLRELGQRLREVRQLGDPGLGHRDDRAAGARGLGERAEGRSRRLAERPEDVEETLEQRRRVGQVLQRRHLAVGRLAEARHRRAQLAQEGREALQLAAQVVAALGAGPGGVARLGDEPRDLGPPVGEPAHDALRVGGEVGDDAALVGEDGQHLVRLAQRRVRAPDRLVEVGTASGQRRAQLAEEDREALPVGAPHDVVDEVDRDRRARLLHGDRRPPGQALLARAGLAVEEVLADQRLRPRLAEDVRAQVTETALGDLDLDDRAVRAAVDLEAGDLPGADARDLDVGAVDEPEGVVELDLVARRAVTVAGARGRQHPRRSGGQHEADEQRAPHGPSGSWPGSQL